MWPATKDMDFTGKVESDQQVFKLVFAVNQLKVERYFHFVGIRYFDSRAASRNDC